MFKRLFSILSLVFMSVATIPLFSQELDPLLRLLVEKKILTENEAKQVQKEYDSQKEESSYKTKKAIDDATKSIKPVIDNLKGLEVGGVYFISYQNGTSFDASIEDGLKSYNKFILKRGYINIKKRILPYLEVRLTPDITQDSTGDYKVRMKYLYADFKWNGNKLFSNPNLKVGMVQTPWIDFEEGFYPYRMQDPVFIERIKVQGASADLGVLFSVNFGSVLPKWYLEEVSKSYPGRWGSFAFGIYNGGGYNTTEKNTNKVIMGRVSIRPIPSIIPGLQFHYSFANGKGNVANNTRWTKDDIFKGKLIYPDYRFNLFAISLQKARFTIAGQYLNGRGSNSGSNYYTPSDFIIGKVSSSKIFEPYYEEGYSLFFDVKLGPQKKWLIMNRYDYFKPDTKGILDLQDNLDIQKRYIFGVGYRLLKDNIIFLDYDKLSHTKKFTNFKNEKTQMKDEERVQLTLQIKF